MQGDGLKSATAVIAPTAGYKTLSLNLVADHHFLAAVAGRPTV